MPSVVAVFVWKTMLCGMRCACWLSDWSLVLVLLKKCRKYRGGRRGCCLLLDGRGTKHSKYRSKAP